MFTRNAVQASDSSLPVGIEILLEIFVLTFFAFVIRYAAGGFLNHFLNNGQIGMFKDFWTQIMPMIKQNLQSLQQIHLN